jgi:enamine deaminase RidA (YjgF/YER057c/UK114 family)
LLAGVAPAPPRDQYVQAVGTGPRLFVAGHDPERGGQLAYRGRVGESVSVEEARAALRLATQNALASARSAVGSFARYRCVALTAFVASAPPHEVDQTVLQDSLDLVAAMLPVGEPPAVWLRPAQGLAGGMPVEVELLLEARPRGGRSAAAISRRRARRRREGPGGARGTRRSAGRTS